VKEGLVQVQERTSGSYLADRTAHIIFLICAVLMVIVIIGVFVFLGLSGFRVFGEGANIQNFFFSTNWDPTGNGDVNGNPSFGAGGLILGSIVITFFSVIIAAPLAFGTALIFTEGGSNRFTRLLQPLIEIFTGMPSVVIGFFGLVVIVPFLQKAVGNITGNHQTAGFGWGAAILVLVIMILPTIISVSIDALNTVPASVREASLALGSTRWQMMTNAVLPAATTGLATAVVLGMARAIGETLAVSLVLNGSKLASLTNLFNLFFQPNVNITQYIAIDFGEASGPARDAYYTLALILLAISFLFVCLSRYLASRSVYK
jgi:phosphate transport system permease protein